ncbi:Protein VTS1 [Smittium mucronatum]|uniref:Protein VTS1 n=1 Tax=Smittium mucronatum TaxID=133383 RepID=A0A1R0H219_9FUNG|nr:Protein VTS1 [Smittium mucronatum]
MMSPSKTYSRTSSKPNQNVLGSRQSQGQGPIHINAKERPASAIFFANATHTLPEANQIDEWFESLTQYEDMLEDMAKVSLDPIFKDELNAIDQWFSVLSEPERTAALYNLIQHSSDVQIRFFITILQQMAKTEQPLSTLYEGDRNSKDLDSYSQYNHNNRGSQLRSSSNYNPNYDSNRNSGFPGSNSIQNYSSYRGDSDRNIGIEDDLRNSSYGPKDSAVDLERIPSESQSSIFNKNSWNIDSSTGKDGYMFGSSSTMLRNRDSMSKKDPVISGNGLDYSNTGSNRWIQNSLHVNNMVVSNENPPNRRSSFLDRPSSLIEADSNPDWRNKAASQNQNFSGAISFGSGNSLNQQNSSNPNLGISSSPRTSGFLLNSGRQSFVEKDRGSIRWSTFSDNLDSYIPVNQDRSPSLTSILDNQNIGDRRSISSRLSMVLSANRDLNSQIPPPPGVYPSLQSSSSFRSSQNNNPSNFSNNYSTSQKKEEIYSDHSSRINSKIDNNGAGVNKSATYNNYSVQNNRYISTDSKSNQYSSNQYSTTKVPNEGMSSVTHSKVQSLIKQKAAGLRVSNNSSNSTQSPSVPSPETRTPKPSIKITEEISQSGLESENKGLKQATEPLDLDLLNDVSAWMKSLRLHKYIPCFEGMNYRQIIELDDADLTKIGVQALGARRKMLKVFESVKLELGC